MSKKFKVPLFAKTNVDIFFASLESQFLVHKIDSELERYSYLLSAFNDYDSLDESARSIICRRPMPDKPYELLSKALIAVAKPSDYSHVRALLKKEHRDDETKPSEFLARLVRIADPDGTNHDAILTDIRETWLKNLPADWHTTLVAVSDLKEAAMKADGLARWQKDPEEAAAFKEATGGRSPSMPVAATTAPAASSQVSALSDSTDVRLARLEKSFADLSTFLMKGGQQQYNNSNNNQQYFGGRNQQRQNNRGNSRGRQGRSPSPSAGNSDVCYPHQKYGDEAWTCRGPFCVHFDAFQSKKSSGNQGLNHQGRQQ